ncbi:MAG: hypothetical protein K2O03_13375 [Lachnospiraceae bacterium]|nr:hypothetical protein [Lachnospiraceae bacterium]
MCYKDGGNLSKSENFSGFLLENMVKLNKQGGEFTIDLMYVNFDEERSEPSRVVF